MKRFFSSLLVVAMLAGLSVKAHADQQVYRTVLHSTAWIVNDEGSGSGAVVDAERGLVLTNAHVVGSQKEQLVVFPAYDGNRLVPERSYYQARMDELAVHGRVLRVDARRDLALIQIDSVPEGITALPIAEESVSPGEAIESVGNPGQSNALWVYNSGTVRQVYATSFPYSSGQVVDATVVETQAPINPGDSGSPMVNSRGELVALNAAHDNEASLMSYGIDVSEIKAFLEGSNKTIDESIQQALDAAGISYSETPTGEFEIDLGMDDGSTQAVWITTHTVQTGNLDWSEVYSVAVSSTDPFSSDLLQEVLEANSHLTVGAWEVVHNDSGYQLIFSAKCPNVADAAAMNELVHGVASFAHDMQLKLDPSMIIIEESDETDGELPIIIR